MVGSRSQSLGVPVEHEGWSKSSFEVMVVVCDVNYVVCDVLLTKPGEHGGLPDVVET